MIINGEITFLHVSFTNRALHEGFKNALCNQSIIYSGIEKDGKQEVSKHTTSESSSLLQNKINNSTLEEGNAHIPFKFASERVGLFAIYSFISLNAAVWRNMCMCAFVSHIRCHFVFWWCTVYFQNVRTVNVCERKMCKFAHIVKSPHIGSAYLVSFQVSMT